MQQLSLFDEQTMIQMERKLSDYHNEIEVVAPIPLPDLMHMVDILNKGFNSEEFISLERLGAGAFGTVVGYKNYAIKYIREVRRPRNETDLTFLSEEASDAYFLKALQPIKAIPRLYAIIDNNVIIMERIDGITVDDYKHEVNNGICENYIDESFNEVFEHSLKEILHLGYVPIDLHGQNVMICKKTGLPRIVDVGMFKETDKNNFSDIDKINLYNCWDTSSAIDWVSRPMSRYIEQKRNPQSKAQPHPQSALKRVRAFNNKGFEKIKFASIHNKVMAHNCFEAVKLPISTFKFHA
jgi:serine/threonine protein kinase